MVDLFGVSQTMVYVAASLLGIPPNAAAKLIGCPKPVPAGQASPSSLLLNLLYPAIPLDEWSRGLSIIHELSEPLNVSTLNDTWKRF
jgi:hypothetical protein